MSEIRTDKKGSCEKNLIAKHKKLVFPFALILAVSFGGVLGYAVNREKSASLYKELYANQKQTTAKKIVYKTFSSSNADFTFEYPDTWSYKEEKDPDDSTISEWTFYAGEQNNDNRVLKVGPLADGETFFSGAGKNGSTDGKKTPYWVRTYPSNDPDTFITAENSDGKDSHIGFIYWQKGKYFANADDITDIYSKDVHVMSYDHSFVPQPQTISEADIISAYEIAQHIAQSVKIK